ncbi:hypothetical protein Taro_001225 [Colocasia esculenta]|uniref:Uncharacterized protein n=1 Tax=Colocasia esculenta TaxID=4460 RepID=A0A843TCX7_COLES|nr:hypothetical protein [Colocasia esculenta]
MQDKYQIQEQKLKKKTSSKHLSTTLQVLVDSHTQESPSPKTNVLEIENLQWRAVVGMVLRLGRTSRDVRRGAQAPAPVLQEHGHGGPSIIERFKRMAPPSFKGDSQPLFAEG